MIVYLAGPISHTLPADAVNWRKWVAGELAKVGVKCLSPMRDTDLLKADEPIRPYGYKDPLITDRAVLARDVFDLRRCDVVLANFIGAKSRSLGTAFEFGAAHILGKPIVSVIGDDHWHDHAMLNESAGYRVASLDHGVEAVRSLLGV